MSVTVLHREKLSLVPARKDRERERERERDIEKNCKIHKAPNIKNIDKKIEVEKNKLDNAHGRTHIHIHIHKHMNNKS